MSFTFTHDLNNPLFIGRKWLLDNDLRRDASFVRSAQLYDSSLNLFSSTENDVLTFSFEVPGIKAEDLVVTLTQRENTEILNIRCNMPKKTFSYEYSLPKQFDSATLTNLLENGVLTFTMKKRPELIPKTIKINITK